MSGQNHLPHLARWGDATAAKFIDYSTDITEGMVVLDAIHQIQAETASTSPAAGTARRRECGSCSAEINGKPRLMCMTRMDTLPPGEMVIVEPMKSFPLIRDLVTDVSWNFEVERIKKFKPQA